MGRKSLANERCTQILEASYRCISKYGLQNTTIKRIAQEAGVQPSILYHYFKDKDEIVERLVEKVVEDLIAGYVSETNGDADAETRFERGIDFLFSPTLFTKELSSFQYDCMAEARHKPKIHKSYREFYQTGRDVILKLLTETGKTSGLSATQAEDLAVMIAAIQDGVSLVWYIDGESVSLKRMRHLTKDLVRLYIKDRAKPADPDTVT